MSFFMWILLIVVILGILYYIGETYGSVAGDNKKKKEKEKESFSDPDSDNEDEPKSAKKKKTKESSSESEDEEEPKPDKKKKAKESFSQPDEDKKKKKKDICFGDFCLPKDRIQEEIEDMDDDTKDELIKMLKK